MPKACIYAGFRYLFYQMALFVGRVISRLRRNYEKIITSDIDADSIVEMIYMDSANEG